MAVLACFHEFVHISLQEIEGGRELLPLIVGIKQQFLVAQRTAEQIVLVVGHQKDRRFCIFQSLPDKSDALIPIEHNSNPNLALKLMAFKSALEAADDSRNDAHFHHIHAELHHHHHLHNIRPLLEVELVRYSKIYDGLGGDLCALQVVLVHSFLDVEPQSAEVAGYGPTCAVELEVGVYVTLAAGAPEGRTHLDHVDLFVCEGSDPHCNWNAGLARKSMQCGGGTPEETRIDFRVLANVETLGRREGKLSFLVPVSIVGLDDVGGIKDGSLRSLLTIAGLDRRRAVIGIVGGVNQALFFLFGLLCLALLEVLQSMSHI